MAVIDSSQSSPFITFSKVLKNVNLQTERSKYTDEVNMHRHRNSALFLKFIESVLIEFRFIP